MDGESLVGQSNLALSYVPRIACNMFVNCVMFRRKPCSQYLLQAMRVEGNWLESKGEGRRVTCGKAVSNILVFGFCRLTRRLDYPGLRRLRGGGVGGGGAN